MDSLNINVFDFLVIGVLIAGILRGKKRGISEELLDFLMWLAIVIGGAFAYKPIGVALMTYANLPVMWANILGYLLAATILFLLFNAIKRAVGEKLVHSDAFGRLEYFLGMAAGGIRFLCVLVFLISVVHAKYTTPAERAAQKKMQQDNFGSITLPTFESMQESIFYQSQSGKFLEKHLKFVLIEAVPPSGRTGQNIYENRRRNVEDAMK